MICSERAGTRTKHGAFSDVAAARGLARFLPSRQIGPAQRKSGVASTRIAFMRLRLFVTFRFYLALLFTLVTLSHTKSAHAYA